MAKLQKFRDKPEIESAGVWIRWQEDIEFHIRATRAPEVRERLKRLGTRIIGGTQSKRDEEALKKVYARHVVIGWRNIQDASGKDVPYSAETAFNLLSNPEFMSLWQWVVDQATNPENFRGEEDDDAEITEADAGNSSASSGSMQSSPGV